MATSMWKISVSFGKKLPPFLRQSSIKQQSTKAFLSATADTDTEVQYPPILPTGDELKYVNKMDEIKSTGTVPEMIHLLQQRQCWNVQMKPHCFHPNFLPVYKHATKTHTVEGLPDSVRDFINTDRVKQISSSLQESVQNFALQEMVYGYIHADNMLHRDYNKAKSFIANIVNHVLMTEIGQCAHILSGEFDHDVEMKSFWERDEKRYQYLGTPLFVLRTQEPLQEFTSRNSDLSVGEVAPYPYKSTWYSIFKKHHNSICFPGYKYGNPINHGHTQIDVTWYNRKKLLEKSQAYHDEVILGNGLMSSFGWMAAMTMYQKHYWDDDLPRPMTGNTIVTDGKTFSFFCYQLNTIALHSRVSDTNNLRNVCWYTKEMPLYDDLSEDGEVININPEVLQTLVGMLMLPPGGSGSGDLSSGVIGQQD